QRFHPLFQLPHAGATPRPPSVALTLQPPRKRAPQRRIEQDRGDGNHQGHEQHDDQDPHERILRSARPARHLLLQRVHQAGSVASVATVSGGSSCRTRRASSSPGLPSNAARSIPWRSISFSTRPSTITPDQRGTGGWRVTPSASYSGTASWRYWSSAGPAA